MSMKCPNCGQGGVSRIGLWPVRLLRRLARRNVYVCHKCMTWWRGRRCVTSLPVESGLSLKLNK